jgi:hypothetical protein
VHGVTAVRVYAVCYQFKVIISVFSEFPVFAWDNRYLFWTGIVLLLFILEVSLRETYFLISHFQH